MTNVMLTMIKLTKPGNFTKKECLIFFFKIIGTFHEKYPRITFQLLRIVQRKQRSTDFIDFFCPIHQTHSVCIESFVTYTGKIPKTI